jgi:hypothetical protein
MSTAVFSNLHLEQFQNRKKRPFPNDEGETEENASKTTRAEGSDAE